ncbi:MAG: hypothetical protein AAF368_09750, partial [Planctomycetota bacterium]
MMNELNSPPPTVAKPTNCKFMATPYNATPRTLREVFLRWFLVVSLAATPSFLWGSVLTADQWPAMLSGVLIFIAAYTWGDLRTAATSWRQSPSVCWTLRTVFGLRIAMTLVFPLGAYVDMFTGAVTVELLEAVHGDLVGTNDWNFALTLLATLVQGVLLNLMLLMLG